MSARDDYTIMTAPDIVAFHDYGDGISSAYAVIDCDPIPKAKQVEHTDGFAFNITSDHNEFLFVERVVRYGILQHIQLQYIRVKPRIHTLYADAGPRGLQASVQPLKLRSQFVAGILSARIWSGDNEPNTWQVTAKAKTPPGTGFAIVGTASASATATVAHAFTGIDLS